MGEMEELEWEKHYDEEFEFPMWRLIKERAAERDISYLAASEEVAAEYVKTIRYGDTKFEEAEIQKRMKEVAELAEREQREKELKGGRQ